MEVIPRGARFQPGARSIRRARMCIANRRVDMVERSPFEQNPACFDVHLLKYAFHQPAHAIFYVPYTHIKLPLLVNRQQGPLAAVNEFELMHVARCHAAAGDHGLDDLVMAVHDNAMAPAIAILLNPLEKAQVVFALVFAYVHAVSIPRAGIAPTAPN